MDSLGNIFPVTEPMISPNIFRLIKSKRMRWAGHVEPMLERRCVYRVLVWNSEGKNHFGDQGVDVSIIL
jgi:hypothetical protein